MEHCYSAAHPRSSRLATRVAMMTIEQIVEKVFPKEWLLPALVAAVGTGVVSFLTAYLTWLSRALEKVGTSPWRWQFIFAVMMLVALGVRRAYRRYLARERSNRIAAQRREAAEAASREGAARLAREREALRESYAKLRPIDRAVLSAFIGVGIRTIPTDRICAIVMTTSSGVSGPQVGLALQRLHDRGILHVGRPSSFDDEVATLLGAHFNGLNDDPSLLAEPATTDIATK